MGNGMRKLLGICQIGSAKMHVKHALVEWLRKTADLYVSWIFWFLFFNVKETIFQNPWCFPFYQLKKMLPNPAQIWHRRQPGPPPPSPNSKTKKIQVDPENLVLCRTFSIWKWRVNVFIVSEKIGSGERFRSGNEEWVNVFIISEKIGYSGERFRSGNEWMYSTYYVTC